jgi:hypothetical protein
MHRACAVAALPYGLLAISVFAVRLLQYVLSYRPDIVCVCSEQYSLNFCDYIISKRTFV